VKFKSLQENLRRQLCARIEDGDLTGLRLAKQTGFKQAHISNFLNRRRGLSLEGMDKVLRVEGLPVLDLLDPQEINRRTSIFAEGDQAFENVFLVHGEVAATQPIIMSMFAVGVLKFEKRFLRRLRPEMEGDREKWERFVTVKVDAHQGMSMYPRLLPGATVLIDRHYNSLKPYRRKESNMYAVNNNGACNFKYVEIAGENLVLRPQNNSYPVEVLALKGGKTGASHIVGRICHAGIET
jgi:hypothetical protein